MSQKRSKNRFMQDIGLCKPLCAAMILCSWLILSPTTAKAADDVAITQAVDQQSTVKGTVVDIWRTGNWCQCESRWRNNWYHN